MEQRKYTIKYLQWLYNHPFVFWKLEAQWILLCYFSTWEKYVVQKYLPKNKYSFASFSNDMGLSLDDKRKDYFDRNTGGQVYSWHEVIQLG